MSAKMTYSSEVNKNEKAVRLVDYLLRVASLRTKIIRNIDEYDRTLWLSSIPQEKGCFTQAWGGDEEHDADEWIEVQHQREPEVPIVFEQCKEWVDRSTLRNKEEQPKLFPEIAIQFKNPAWREGSEQPEYISRKDRLENHPEVARAWNQYIQERWLPWVKAHNIWESIHKVYSSLFAIYQEQLRLGEEYELVLGLGLLSWQPPNSPYVRRHLVVANALLEFEARLGKFTVRPMTDGANVRPELDMLDIEDQPARVEEAAKASLINAGENPWDKGCIEDVLKALVNSIRAEGKYNDTLEAKNNRMTEHPLVEYAPALILRRRSSRGLTETLKRIRKRIEEGEVIPPEFADIAEIKTHHEINGNNDPGETNSEFDSEIFFPKPSNESQRQIVDKLRASNGVLVQGPPGTGKSHTIANLICHLLATGQRTLITAKTPRALQVLKELIPEELRPLCINLLGSGLEEKRSLEASVGGILRKNDGWNKDREADKRAKLEDRINGLREEKAKLDRRLRDIREAETHSHSIAQGAYRGTAAQIAQAMDRDREKYGWFDDAISLDEECPLKERELLDALSGLRKYVSEDKRRERQQHLPTELPTPEHFADIVFREVKLKEEEKAATQDADVQIADKLTSLISTTRATVSQDSNTQIVNDYEKDYIIKLRDSLSEYLNIRQKLLSSNYPWVQQAVCDIAADRSALWHELYKVTSETISDGREFASLADETDIDIPNNINESALYEDACKLRGHLENGGKLGWGPFRPRIVKESLYLLKSVRVNGKRCIHLSQIKKIVDIIRVRLRLEKAWEFWSDRYETPGGPLSLQIRLLEDISEALELLLSLEKVIAVSQVLLNHGYHIAEPSWNNEAEVGCLAASCRLALARREKQLITEELYQYEFPLMDMVASGQAHQVVHDVQAAIRNRNIDAFGSCYNRIQVLKEERIAFKRLDDYTKQLHKQVPRFTDKLIQTCHEEVWKGRIESIGDAWRWAQTRIWLEEYIRKEDVPSLSQRVKQVEDEISEVVANLASIHAWSFCFSRLKEDHRRHMEAWCKHFKSLTQSGRGKRDYRNRLAAQRSLNECKDAVPAWVMPLHRVWDTIDPVPGMFDMIIVDEASQCGIEALPLLYLGKKILIVGDDKQISPAGEFQEVAPIQKLQDEYLSDFNFKEYFDVNSSLFSHGRLRHGASRIVLREHFRCMPEVIRFSNDLCYSDTRLIPLRQYGPDRLKPIEHVFVNGGYREGAGNRIINRPEAARVVDTIAELCSLSQYEKKTMGVIVLQGEAQAKLIEDQLLERLGAEKMERRKLICGNPYSFQGDERDIIFLSMVAAPNERIGALTKESDRQRFNVAASRARDQMYLFHSVTCEDLSINCLRRQLLEFFENTKPSISLGLDIEELEHRASLDNRSIVEPPSPFDSWFEVDVALELLRKRYNINPQFEVAGKHIDLVIEGGQARLAIECDGDEWHGADRYEADMQRQRMLERCGWEFYRVRESAFYANKDEALKKLWRMLEERSIYPSSKQENTGSHAVARSNEIIVESKSSLDNGREEAENNVNQLCTVRVGSTVVYISEDDGNECEVLITTQASNPDWGTINANTPIAKALIGNEIGNTVVVHLPSGTARLKIVDIR